MSRILVAYASSHGQTREIARMLAARFESRGHLAELADAGVALPEPRGFDAIVLGSRVQTGRHAPAIEHYAKVHRDTLAAMPTAFFSVSMSAAQRDAGDDPNGYLERFTATTGWRPSCRVAFAGALKYQSYSWILRRVMRWMAKRGGHATDMTRDHVYTDWAAVTRFADHIVGDLAPRPEPVRAPATAGTAA